MRTHQYASAAHSEAYKHVKFDELFGNTIASLEILEMAIGRFFKGQARPT